jgi:hypothetical protein
MLLFQIFNFSLLPFLFLVNSPDLGKEDIFLSWDAFVFNQGAGFIDHNKLNLTSLEYIQNIPDYFFQSLFQNLFDFNTAIISRIIILCVSQVLISNAILFFSKKDLYSILLISIFSSLLFVNIQFQWEINNGVLFSIAKQFCYLINSLILILALFDSKKLFNIELICLICLEPLISLWSFSFVIPQLLFIGIFCIPLILLRWREIVNLKYLKIFLFFLVIAYLLMGFLFFNIIKINHFSLFSGMPEQFKTLVEGGTYQNIKGGILWQIAGLTDWSMYTSWPNRIFGLMDFRIDIFIPQLFHLSLIFIIILYFTKCNKNIIYFLSLIFILICAFFAKGSQEPFGKLYIYLINNFKIFQSIRTPDNKFGIYLNFSILLLSIAVLLKGNIANLTKLVVVFISSSYLVLCSYNLYTGETTFGMKDQTTGNFAYAANISKDYPLIQQLDSFERGGYVGVLFPGFGNVKTPSGIIGYRDYLSYRYIDSLLNYWAATEGPYGHELKSLSDLSGDHFESWFYKRGVSYIVIRKSSINDENNFIYQRLLSKFFNLVYEDGYSKIYFRDGVPRRDLVKNSDILGRFDFLSSGIFSLSILSLILIFLYYFYSKLDKLKM